MTDKHVQTEAPHSNMEKDPSTWVTGGEKMTGAQMSYLKTLSEEAKVDFDESLTKAEASERIDELQQQTGRGASSHPAPHANHPAPAHRAPAASADNDNTADNTADDSSDAGEEDPGAAEGDLFEAEAMRSEAAHR